MSRLLPIFLLLLAQTSGLLAQVVGGDNVYEFLNLSPSARVTALGGNLITVRDDDVNLAAGNPSLLNPAMHQALAFNHNFFPAGIGHGYFAYGHDVKKWKTTFHGGVQYVNYGTFNTTDDIGNINGEFKAKENAFTIGAARELYERVSIGANVRYISSRLESYSSSGLAADLAATFHDTSRMFNLAIVLKNFGTQLSTYTPDNREPMPVELQAGLSKQLRYLPFRFSIIYRYLNRWNILYDDPNSQEDSFFFGDTPQAKDNSFVDNFARHFIFNGEFLFGKKDNFRIRMGYNHLRRKELSVRNLRSLAGFSMGLGFKINRFRLEYGRSVYHLGVNLNHLSISTNLREFR